MFRKLELGIIYDSEGKIVNHRSLIKVLLNPFLRLIGCYIATVFDIDTNTLKNPVLRKCPKRKSFKFLYNADFEYKVIKRRRLI